jgi:hypothetical protein
MGIQYSKPQVQASGAVNCRLSRKSATTAERTTEAGQPNPAHHQAGTTACSGGGGGIMTGAALALFGANDHAAISAAKTIAIRLIGVSIVPPNPQHGLPTLVSFNGADNEFPANSALCKDFHIGCARMTTNLIIERASNSRALRKLMARIYVHSDQQNH